MGKSKDEVEEAEVPGTTFWSDDDGCSLEGANPE